MRTAEQRLVALEQVAPAAGRLPGRAPSESEEAAARRAAVEAEALQKAQEEWLNRKQLRVWHFLSLSRQCRVKEPPTVEVLKAPQFGTLSFGVEEGTANRLARKEFEHCAGTKGPGRSVYYVIKDTERHRTDTDTISLRVRRAGGNVDIQEFEVNRGTRTVTRTKVVMQ